MECRSCKAVINADLNPKRTQEQLHESSVRRRVADLLLAGENQRIDHAALFRRFGSKCFKTGVTLDIKNRKSWEIDHTLPSQWLYPLSVSNATLLSKEANGNKSGRWPSQFYTNEDLKRLAKIQGADLALLARKTPVVNQNIDVDACVTRMLNVRGATDIAKRVESLKNIIQDYDLVNRLSQQNKKILGYRT
jgi:CRISPR/Cas system Type II protein with McrA/HNH and RuvC-like nuclease domain